MDGCTARWTWGLVKCIYIFFIFTGTCRGSISEMPTSCFWQLVLANWTWTWMVVIMDVPLTISRHTSDTEGVWSTMTIPCRPSPWKSWPSDNNIVISIYGIVFWPSLILYQIYFLYRIFLERYLNINIIVRTQNFGSSLISRFNIAL